MCSTNIQPHKTPPIEAAAGRRTTMCPPQPSTAHWYELLTMSVYHSARSVDADGVNFSTDLRPARKCAKLAHARPRPHEVRRHSRLERHARLNLVRGLDNDAKRGSAAATEREEQVLVLALVRGAVHAGRRYDLDLHLEFRREGGISSRGARHRGGGRRDRGGARTHHAVRGEAVLVREDAVSAALHAEETPAARSSALVSPPPDTGRRAGAPEREAEREGDRRTRK